MSRLLELRSWQSEEPCVEAWEATNVHSVATFIAAAAREREETRGSHWREDFPEPDDLHWRARINSQLVEGTVHTTVRPIS